MSKLIAALAAGLFCVSVAQAQEKKPMEKPAAPAAAKKLTPQQSRMRACNKEAKEKKLKGAERKKFMSGCLKKH
ncbi:MAG TPA: PsiF family protein [Burkholderiales bacterium]|nr:PsiF family protein [Burkholderiales bacterium]